MWFTQVIKEDRAKVFWFQSGAHHTHALQILMLLPVRGTIPGDAEVEELSFKAVRAMFACIIKYKSLLKSLVLVGIISQAKV